MPAFDISPLQTGFKHAVVQASFCDLYHCLGFITAVASCPERITAKEWLAQLLRDQQEQPEFSDPEDAKVISSGLIGWWYSCDSLFEHSGKLQLPPEIRIDENDQPSPELIEFASGYLRATAWLSGSWHQLLPKDNEEAFRSINVLNIILSRFIDEQGTREKAPEMIRQLPDLSGCLKTLPSLISAIGMLGKDLLQSTEDPPRNKPLDQAENIRRNVGRNDQCPCGSGKKFKKCCLH